MSVPGVIRIEPSGACNLRCIHCPTGTEQLKDRGIMSNDTFDIIMKNLENNVPRVAVMYHGGEPFLCKNLCDWIERLKGIGVKYIKTVTNGTMLNDSIIKKLIHSGIDLVEVSIDGQSPEENDFIRRGSNCRETISNVKKLIELKGKLNSVTPSVLISNAQFNKNNSFGKPDVPAFLLEAFKDSVSYQSMYFIAWSWQKTSSNPPAYHVENNYCPFINETMTVRWNGDVVPCCHDIMSEYVMGNIHESSLEDIRDGEAFRVISDGIRNDKPVGLCENCFKD